MATTVLTSIIIPALQDLGVLGVGGSVSANDSAIALAALNAMIDSWGAEDLTMYTVQRSVWPLVANQQVYTMGPGGDFDAPRPNVINDAGIVLAPLSNPPIEVQIPIINDDAWASVSIKPLQSIYPTFVYPGYEYPLCRLSFWPVPQYSGYQVALYIPQAITQFAAISTVFTAPPGYLEAMEYNLALRLAPKFGREAPRTVIVAAKLAMDKVKSRNSPAPLLRVDPALRMNRGSWSVYTDSSGPRGNS